MNLWGYVMMAAGCFFLLWATTKSEFFLYRTFVAQAKMMWKENVHRAFQFAGLMMIIIGALMAIGIIHR